MKPPAPISVVHIASGDLWAGAEVQLFTLAKTLHDIEDVTVRVILLNHGELENRFQELHIPIEVLDESQLNSLEIFWRLRKLLNSWQPNVVHTHRIKENILGGLAARLADNIPSMRTVHGAPEHRPDWRKVHKRIIYILDWLIGRYLQRKIIAVSEDLRNLLEASYPPAKILVVENGIDIEGLAPYVNSHIYDNSIRQRKPFKIGLVGRLVPVKRVDVYIKMAKYVRDHYPELSFHFHIYGDGPLQEELAQLTASLVCDDIITFEGHRADIHQQIASLDTLLITSDHEGLPMTLLEAMALGIPVVAHAVGGIPKACDQGLCCWLVSNNTIEGFVESLLECLKNQVVCDTRVKLAQERIQLMYTAVNNAKSYQKIYRNLKIT